MAREMIAACAVLLVSTLTLAADPSPVWELPMTPSPQPAAAPAWLSYSPDGRAIVAVTVRMGKGDELLYHLRVWDAVTRKERFNAPLGSGRSFHFGDDLAAFPTDDTVMTGGPSAIVRSLENGTQTASYPTGGLADHSIWAVPDLKESFHFRRDPQRFDMPIEVIYRGPIYNQYDEFGGRMVVGGPGLGGPVGRTQYGTQQTTLPPPRDGLRAEVLGLNPGRTRIVVAFRDEALVNGRPRHVLAMYRIKTVENFEIELASEVANPHSGTVTAITFARNGRTLATGGEDGSISFWDISHGTLTKPRATLSGVADHRVYAMAFSHDWRYLAAVTWDKTKPNLILIDADSVRPVRAIKLERQMSNVAWHPDGHTLLSVGASGTIQAWDVASLVKGN